MADDYDSYFAYNRLFQFDEQVVLRALQAHGAEPGDLVADLGCGTGRILVTLGRLGIRGLAIDLSEPMLAVVRAKIAKERLPIQCVRANLVQLEMIRDEVVDGAVSLFSTLGMIRGHAHRQQALQHACRILKPGKPFVIHVHNYWFNLRDPGGPWWVLRTLLRAVAVRDMEAGDKFFDYRGVPKMFLHVFTQRELCVALRGAGFHLRQLIPLDVNRYRELRWPWLFGRLRANGWIAVCVKPR
jgi:ubiquinone/menaquinone biosynthesis C-methylase UbiE